MAAKTRLCEFLYTAIPATMALGDAFLIPAADPAIEEEQLEHGISREERHS